MTVYGATDPQVLGQPVSPFFGAQQNVRYTGAPVIPQPAQVNAPQVTAHESISRGALPMNANATAVGAVSTGAQNPTPMADMLGNGCGNQCNLGVAVPPNGGNPNSITTLGVNNQIFVEGIANAADGLSTGPVPTNVETMTSAPVPGSTTVNNLTLSGFQG